jgi:dolichyl-phosphate-mannose-protein mannosyltransferase
MPLAALAQAAFHALAILVFALACFSAGRSIVDRFLPGSPFGQRVAFALALGTGLVGQALFLLGITGQLSRGNVAIVLALAAIAGCVPIRRSEVSSFDWRSTDWRSLDWRSLDWRLTPAGLVLLLATVPSFLLALYPPVGFDATMYHLPFARLFAERGALVFADTLRFPVFPQLGEMPFTAALLLSDDVAAQLTQWLALAVTTIALASLTRELENAYAAILAAALWIGNPLALYLGGNAYIDSSLAMYVTLAFAAWHRWRRDEHLGWAMLAGAFAGCAAATKYHGLFFIAVLFAAFVWRNRRAAALFALTAILLAAPWYARIASATGNPLFPYLSAVFGRHEWQTTLDANLEKTASDPAAALSRASVNPIASLVDRALIGRVRGRQSPFNPWLLLGLPLVLATAWIDRRQRFPLLAALAYAIVISPLDWRFMIPIAPLLCIGIAGGVTRAWSRFRPPSRALASVIATAFAAPGLIWMALLLRGFGPIPANPAQRDAFLTRRITVYDSLRFLRRAPIPPVVYLFSAENAAYYCPTRCMGDLYGPYRQQLLEPLLNEPEQLAARLRGFGVEVLVLPNDARHLPLRDRLRRSRAFRPIFSGGHSEAFGLR